MNDDRFDDIIRSKLENYKSNSQADWELFKASKLLNDASYDASFDSELKERLRNYELNQTPFEWQDLYSAFRQQVYLRNQVIAIKSGELLILFLSLFTFFNFYDINIFNEDQHQQIAEIEIHHEVLNEETVLIQNRDEVFEGSIVSIENRSTERDEQDDIRIDSENHGLATTDFSSDQTIRDDLVSYDRNTLNDVIHRPSEESITRVNTADDESLSRKPLTQLGLVPGLAPTGLEYQKNTIEIKAFKDLLILPDIAGNNDDWLSISSMINNNTINSPRDLIYNLDEQVLYTPGFSISANYSRYSGAWEHLIGLSYSRISYAPYPVKESYQSEDGINVVSLNNIRYHMMSVPLFSRLHFIQTEDWSLFGGFGAQFGLVLHEFYDISDELDVPLPAPQARGSETEYRSRLSQKEFTRAVFNGGRFSDNIFIHARLGFGVQRHLGENMHLFLSAEYLHHLVSPLGPNRDKINVLSFGAGMKFRI